MRAIQALNQISPITVVGRWQNPAGVACTSHGAMPKGLRLTIWLDLMSCATAADAPEVQAMAGVLATAFEVHGFDQLPISGLSDSATPQRVTASCRTRMSDIESRSVSSGKNRA